MRVTNSMLLSTLTRDLNNHLEKMSDSQRKMSSGKRINTPSDDPVGLIDSLRIRTNIMEFGQFKQNAGDGKAWLEATDISLNEFQDILHRVRELTIRAANDSLPAQSREAVSKEIDQLKDQLIQVANTKQGDRFLFAGTMTRTQPYDENGGYQANTDSMEYEIGLGVKVPINVTGPVGFNNVFTVLDNLMNDLSTGDTSALSATRLGEIDSALDSLLTVRADVGSRVNRMDLAINRIDSQSINMTNLLSKAEDIDMAQLIMELKVQENVYRASLAAGARIVQPSLVDFMR